MKTLETILEELDDFFFMYRLDKSIVTQDPIDGLLIYDRSMKIENLRSADVPKELLYFKQIHDLCLSYSTFDNIKNLKNLRILEGGLWLTNCTNLKSLEGLECLETVKFLYLKGCTRLVMSGINPDVVFSGSREVIDKIYPESRFQEFSEYRRLNRTRPKVNPPTLLDSLIEYKNLKNLNVSVDELKEILNEIKHVDIL